jgi:hypothetical protein
MFGPTSPFPAQQLLYITALSKTEASRIRHRLGSSQEYQSLFSSAIFLRLLDRMLSVSQSWSVCDKVHGWTMALKWRYEM